MGKVFRLQWKSIFTLSVIAVLVCGSSITFPASLAVVRNIDPSLTIDTFLKAIGCCSFDSFGEPNGYTIISLDGLKSTSTTTTIQTVATPLAYWVNAYSAIAASKPGKGGQTDASVQQYILNQLHNNGISLLLNAFTDQAPISQNSVNAFTAANTIIDLVKRHSFDGVSIEFCDFKAVTQGKASAWLQQLLTTLRVGLPGKQVVLIVPVTMVTNMFLLQQPLVSALVDLFVLKYYGFSREDYTTYNTLFVNSSVIVGTAFGQLLQSKTVGIDLCRTIIAKPALSRLIGYINPNTLGGTFEQAKTNFGWFGGYANLDYQSDPSGQYQMQTLQSMRRNCLFSGDCFCR